MCKFNKYNTICTYKLNNIDIDHDIIYYLYDYYTKTQVDNNPTNKKYHQYHDSFIHLKQNKYDSHYDFCNFKVALFNFLNILDGNWYISKVPGHEKSTNENICTGVTSVIKSLILPSRYKFINAAILRKETVEKKATSSHRNTNYLDDLKSLTLHPRFNPTGKSIIVVDDITTSGNSLIACKELLLKYGAKRVILLAFGKTKELNNG